MCKIKNRVCSLLCAVVVLIGSTVPHMYIQGAEVVVGVTAWEILETIMLSLGVTITVQESSLVDEVCQEVVDTYNLWVESNGFDKDFAKLKTDLTELVQSGTDRTIQIADECWDGLRAWVKSLSNEETYICDSFTYAFNKVTNCAYTIPYKYPTDGVQLVCGNISVDFIGECKNYGMVSFVYRDGLREILIYSDEPFTCNISESYSSAWIKEPSNSEYLSYLDKQLPKTYYRESEKYEGSYNIGNGVYETSEIYYTYFGTHSGEYKELTCNLGCIDLRDCSDWLNALHSALCRVMYNIRHEDNTLAYDVVGGSAVGLGAWDIITRGRTWEDDEVKGDVVITVPDDVAGDIVRVGSGETTISDVISIGDSIAIPVDTATDTAIDYPWTITDTIDYVNTVDDDTTDTDEDTDVVGVVEGVGGINDINLKADLMNLFPFCIPFDLYHAVMSINATPKEPSWSIPIKIGSYVNYTITIDFERFSVLAKILKVGLIILWICGLVAVTSKLIKW